MSRHPKKSDPHRLPGKPLGIASDNTGMNTPGFQRLGQQAGTYVLILKNRSHNIIPVGRLGALPLNPGIYAYIGSAFGPGGIAARCQHHTHTAARPHWHIDYIRPSMELDEIWFSHDPQRREHQWADLIEHSRNAQPPFPGFGASDCSCLTHLFFFPTPPSFESFRRRAYRALTDQAPIRRETLATDHGHTIE